MILPIVAFGHPILKQIAKPIEATYPELESLINNMKETMASANGVGLAAPQVGLPIRLIVIDATPYADEIAESDHPLKRTFINLEIIEESGDEWAFCEGCLSIPQVNEDVYRKPTIVIEYDDVDFKHHRETLSGMLARIVQHECDHLNGKVFTDRLSTLRRTMLRRRLDDISKGQVRVAYRMAFPLKKGR